MRVSTISAGRSVDDRQREELLAGRADLYPSIHLRPYGAVDRESAGAPAIRLHDLRAVIKLLQ